MSLKTFAVNPLHAFLLAATVAPLTYAASDSAETVYVSATRSETTLLPVATQIIVIDSEQIRTSGADLISEVLRSQAGIQLTDSDGSGNRNVTASMRGLSGANNVLVLVDGRKLNNPSSAAPALNTIPLSDVERIEIMQGSAGVLYGDQAVAGVINIITRRAKSGELNGDIALTRGSYGLQEGSLSVHQGFQNGLSYNFSAQERDADNYRANNRSANSNVLGNLRYDFSTGFIFVERESVNDNLRLPGSLTEAEAAVTPRKTDKPNEFSNQDSTISRAGGGITVTDSVKLLVDYADRDEGILGNLDGVFTQGLQQKNISPRIVVSVPILAADAITTIGFDGVDANYNIHSAYGDTHASQTIRDYYAQTIVPVVDRLTLTTGARHSSVDDAATVTNSTDVEAKHKSQDANSYELGAHYALENHWKLFARVAQGFRYANADDYSYTLKGFDFLLPQKSLSKEVGANWDTNDLHVKYSLYDMTVRDEIIYDAASYANINSSKSARKGATLDIDLPLDNWIDLKFNYTYTDAVVSEGVNSGKRVPYVAKDTANAGVDFHWVESLNLWVGGNYLGSRYRYSDDSNAQGLLPSRVIWDANLRWLPVDTLAFSARIKNITNERYADYEGYSSWQAVNYEYPQAGRNFSLSLNYHF